MSKKLLRALGGEAVWPPPVWLMRQAGRYLPEYRELRAKAPDFVAFCTTPQLAVEATLQPIRRFAFDAAILFADILLLPWAMGASLAYREGEGPVLSPVRDAEAIAAFRPRGAERLGAVMETVAAVKRQVGEAALIGFAGGPFTVACYLVEGRAERDWPALRRLLWEDPALFESLLDLLTEETVSYLEAQIEAGAEAVMLFDSWAGLLPASRFRRYVLGPVAAISARLRRSHPDVPLLAFPRAANALLAEFAAGAGVAAVSVDSGVDLPALARQLSRPVALQGNLDPWALLAGGTALEDEAKILLEGMRGRPFIFNLGHGVLPATPPAHVARLRELVAAA